MKCERDGIVFFQLPEWDPYGLTVHGFFGRVGGVSPPPFNTLNIGASSGDDAQHVAENLSQIARVTGTQRDCFVFLRQVHGDRILYVAKDGARADDGTILDSPGDALCTDRTAILLAVRTADCLPVLLLDPLWPAVAIVHAGWRGTLKRILKGCLREMSRLFNTRPEMMRVGFGPGIRSCCFLVDKEVADRFCDAFPNDNTMVSSAPQGKWRVDLYRANTATLLEEGVRKDHLFYEPLCTCCHHDAFFSVRGDGGITGRQISLVGLKAARKVEMNFF